MNYQRRPINLDCQLYKATTEQSGEMNNRIVYLVKEDAGEYTQGLIKSTVDAREAIAYNEFQN